MDSLASLGEYKRRAGVPVTASETLSTRWGFRDLLEQQAVDFIMPDIQRISARKSMRMKPTVSGPAAAISGFPIRG